jgi:hypothetical protein
MGVKNKIYTANEEREDILRKKEEPKRPHTLKTAGRETTGRAKGFGLSFLGTLPMITGIIVFILALEVQPRLTYLFGMIILFAI